MIPKGWYVSISVLDNIEIKRLPEFSGITKEDNLIKLEQIIISEFELRIESIFERLKKDFPQREHLIEEIQKLWKHELYYALITLAYTQADGFCRDTFNHGFFDTDKKKKNHRLIITTHEPLTNVEYIKAILEQEKNEVTKFVGPNPQDIDEESYNRHLVMHGHSKIFGTKKNAIRAILLLEFVADLKMHKDNYINDITQ